MVLEASLCIELFWKGTIKHCEFVRKVYFYRVSTDLVVSAGKVRELFPRQLVDALDHLKTWWIHYDMEILLVSISI